MKHTVLIRLCGLASMAGGVLYATLGLVILLRAPNLPESIGRIQSVLFVLLVLGAMAAIAALHALQRERYGWLGTLASLIAFVGLALILVGGLGGLFLIGLLVATMGIIALGTVTITARILPWWCGAALIAGSPFSGLLFYLFSPAEDSLVGVPWALVGYAVFRARTHLPERFSRVR